jgi:hypothetical protein
LKGKLFIGVGVIIVLFLINFNSDIESVQVLETAKPRRLADSGGCFLGFGFVQKLLYLSSLEFK